MRRTGPRALSSPLHSIPLRSRPRRAPWSVKAGAKRAARHGPSVLSDAQRAGACVCCPCAHQLRRRAPTTRCQCGGATVAPGGMTRRARRRCHPTPHRANAAPMAGPAAYVGASPARLRIPFCACSVSCPVPPSSPRPFTPVADPSGCRGCVLSAACASARRCAQVPACALPRRASTKTRDSGLSAGGTTRRCHPTLHLANAGAGPAAYVGASLARLRIPFRACSVPCSVRFHRHLPASPAPAPGP
ncbi:hypothetical protein HYPSUDRAFT_852246 [Hypholoma sublateritium FD-334 SS-4]|uniref:Uncharacterized protein n=1 Tax=Hypholoma sublateritium (strain FD-334 SS-4) TaxID=945553 RepID=A0A0D2KZE2_HYPSF|nr:hypothetical protein HYPSUDRAFT_852246 [Hypholoma sublateritium FD-334 SS-4]